MRVSFLDGASRVQGSLASDQTAEDLRRVYDWPNLYSQLTKGKNSKLVLQNEVEDVKKNVSLCKVHDDLLLERRRSTPC
jgi:hypothetical protein